MPASLPAPKAKNIYIFGKKPSGVSCDACDWAFFLLFLWRLSAALSFSFFHALATLPLFHIRAFVEARSGGGDGFSPLKEVREAIR